MEFLVILFLLSIFVLAPIIGGIALVAVLTRKRYHSKSELAEIKVNNAMVRLGQPYTIFENIILRSRGNTAHTEIDHVIVSPYGIFCVETKSHKGSIYAYEKNANWTQYLGHQKYSLNSGTRQGYKHVKALEDLIGSNLKSPIHSYVVFPNAYKLVTDSKVVFNNIDALITRISKHKQRVYDVDECTRILQSLAYESSKKDALISVHIEEVQAYLAAKSA